MTSSHHRLQETRFELKYIIDEGCARGIRDFARSYLVHDEHADPAKGYSYPIYSAYLDGPGYGLFHATVQGHKNRFKLRARYYNDNPDSPVYFEIKRRVSDAILKRRAAVRREAALALLAGHSPQRSDLVHEDDLSAFDALNQFCDLRLNVDARPRVIVSYTREAWVTAENNNVRLTFDRGLFGIRWQNRFTTGEDGEISRPCVPGVVLELKFTDRFPRWMADLVRVFNLRRCSMAKYVHCVVAMESIPGMAAAPLIEAMV